MAIISSSISSSRVSRVMVMSTATVNDKSIEERGGDEQRRHDRRVIGLAGDEKAEDGAGAGGERETPGERQPSDDPSEPGRARSLTVHHREEIGRDDRHKARVEVDVPCEDRAEIVVRDGDEHALRPAEIEHQHHEAAGEQGDGEDARQAGVGLVGETVEDRRDRGDIERARGRHDQEHGEHMRQAPDDLVAHAGDDVAVLSM